MEPAPCPFLRMGGSLGTVIWLIPGGNSRGSYGRDGSLCPRRRGRLVLRRCQAAAYRPASRLQNDRAARGAAQRASAAAFDSRFDADRGGPEFLPAGEAG